MMQIKKPRRTIAIGRYSLAIALPKVWIEQHNIKKKDLLQFEINNNCELVIRPLKTGGEIGS